MPPRLPATAATPRPQADGIAPTHRPDLLTRAVFSVLAVAEALNRRQAILGTPPIYDNGDFPWAAEIVAATPSIRAELDVLMVQRGKLPPIHSISPDAASITRDEGWKVFILVAYGIRSDKAIAHCPETWRAVSRIPGLRTAMFSILEPGKRLPPHRGPYNGVLRLHLGLDVPSEGAAIVIDGETRNWREGEVLIFDDAFEHAAWNESSQCRVVLFVDFERPLRFPSSIVNRMLLDLAPRTTPLRDAAARLFAWDKEFHGGR